MTDETKCFLKVSRNTFKKMTKGLSYHWILFISPPVCNYYDSGEMVAYMFDEFMGTPPEYYVTEAYMKSWRRKEKQKARKKASDPFASWYTRFEDL